MNFHLQNKLVTGTKCTVWGNTVNKNTVSLYHDGNHTIIMVTTYNGDHFEMYVVVVVVVVVAVAAAAAAAAAAAVQSLSHV